MNIAEIICREARRLPESLAREVLDFIGYIESKHGFRDQGIEHLREAQTPVMDYIWDNPEDEVWNDL